MGESQEIVMGKNKIKELRCRFCSKNRGSNRNHFRKISSGSDWDLRPPPEWEGGGLRRSSYVCIDCLDNSEMLKELQVKIIVQLDE
jgi:hypothetical protein